MSAFWIQKVAHLGAVEREHILGEGSEETASASRTPRNGRYFPKDIS
jgi:hypothetical protein